MPWLRWLRAGPTSPRCKLQSGTPLCRLPLCRRDGGIAQKCPWITSILLTGVWGRFFFSSYFVNQGGYCSNRTNPTLRLYGGVPASPGGMYGYKRDKKINMPPKTEVKKIAERRGQRSATSFLWWSYGPADRFAWYLKHNSAWGFPIFPWAARRRGEESMNTFYLQSEQRIFQMARWHHTSSRAEAWYDFHQ